jgi:hypothetical protein
MNRRQAGVLALAVAALTGVLLFPPWVAVSNWADGHADRDPIGRHFLLTPPGPALPAELETIVEQRRRAGAALYSGPDFYVVDTTRLVIPLAVLAAFTVVGLVVLRDRSLRSTNP